MLGGILLIARGLNASVSEADIPIMSGTSREDVACTSNTKEDSPTYEEYTASFQKAKYAHVYSFTMEDTPRRKSPRILKSSISSSAAKFFNLDGQIQRLVPKTCVLLPTETTATMLFKSESENPEDIEFVANSTEKDSIIWCLSVYCFILTKNRETGDDYTDKDITCRQVKLSIIYGVPCDRIPYAIKVRISNEEDPKDWLEVDNSTIKGCKLTRIENKPTNLIDFLKNLRVKLLPETKNFVEVFKEFKQSSDAYKGSIVFLFSELDLNNCYDLKSNALSKTPQADSSDEEYYEVSENIREGSALPSSPTVTVEDVLFCEEKEISTDDESSESDE